MEALNLCIDQGNTRIKIALFQGDDLIQDAIFSNIAELITWIKSLNNNNIRAIYSSSSTDQSDELPLSSILKMDAGLPLPVKIKYDSKESLGNDRKANACAAFGKFPGKNALVIDAGTCITFDLTTADGTFIGGAISPGVQMRAKAMHSFTARLPEITPPFENLTSGQSTIECLHSGALHGAVLEVDGRIEEFSQQFEDLHVLLTGGDALYFERALKNATFADSILTLRGLNEILKYQK